MTNKAYKNETIKRKFYSYLANSSKGFSPTTIDCYDGAICLWEDFSKGEDFLYFSKTKAEEFKEWLRNKKKVRSSENVSLSYCYDMLRYLRCFFNWLSQQKGYRKITQSDVDYLNLSKKERRVAMQPKSKVVPSLEQVKKVIENIKGENEVEMRDRALLSLALLTGARITALTSLPLRSFDRERQVIDQSPELNVKTKFSKRIVSPLISFSYKEPLGYFVEWVNYLTRKGFTDEDPIFPATKVQNGTKDELGYFNTGEVEPTFWQSTSTARKIFEQRFTQAGISYHNPHSFRHLLVKEISKLHLTEEQRKAFSQSLGHEDVGTTFGSYGYGYIDEDRQIEIVNSIDFEGKHHRKEYVFTEEGINELIRKAKEGDEV
ncbi:MAG: hypothetical protein JWN37_509 [Candidatus Nomurabacteria bacterium]|nr:hypothetical protein [Candidatus Nomurabacteria bacterium]